MNRRHVSSDAAMKIVFSAAPLFCPEDAGRQAGGTSTPGQT
jgi:hypothetical protein